MTTELNIQDNESSDSEDNDKSCLLWGIGGCFLSTFGTSLTITTLIANDSNPHEISLKLAVGIVMIATGIGFCGAGILLARYGSFPAREPAGNVNETTPFVGFDKRM